MANVSSTRNVTEKCFLVICAVNGTYDSWQQPCSLWRPVLPSHRCRKFGSRVWKLVETKAQQRPIACRRFFCARRLHYGGCAWGTLGCAGSFVPGLPHLCVVRHPLCGSDGWRFLSDKGAVPMAKSHAPAPSAIADRIAAHRAMALAALRADSSTSSRMSRYNHHMNCARSLELILGLARGLRTGGGK